MRKLLLVILLGLNAWVFADLDTAKKLYEEKKYDEALPLLNQLAEQGGSQEIFGMMVTILKDRRDQGAYLSAVKRFVKAGGKIDYDTAWNLGNYGHQMKDYDSVVFFSKICSALSPNNHSVYNLMGVAYFYLKNYRLSVVALKSAVALSPNEAVYAANLARSYETMGQYENAAKYYRLSLKNDPGFQRSAISLKRVESLIQR